MANNRPPELPLRDMADRARPDRGSTSLTAVLVWPVVVFFIFMAFQVTEWTLDRSRARAIARDTAVMIGRGGVSLDDGRLAAQVALGMSSDGTSAGSELVLEKPEVVVIYCTTAASPPPPPKPAAAATDWAEELAPIDSSGCHGGEAAVGDEVRVTITGKAPGLVRGTSVDLTVTESARVEGFDK